MLISSLKAILRPLVCRLRIYAKAVPRPWVSTVVSSVDDMAFRPAEVKIGATQDDVSQNYKVMEEENQRYRGMIDTYQAEAQRTSESLLPHMKNPLPQITQGPGGSLQDKIRGTLLVPGWQPFQVGGILKPLPNATASDEEFASYVAARLPDFTDQQRQKILSKLLTLRHIDYKGLSKILELAPTPDVDGYQFDWWTLHAPTVVSEEREKLMDLLDDALKGNEATIAVLFMAFNFRIFLISSVNCRVNDPRFFQEILPSPFVYMMV